MRSSKDVQVITELFVLAKTIASYLLTLAKEHDSLDHARSNASYSTVSSTTSGGSLGGGGGSGGCNPPPPQKLRVIHTKCTTNTVLSMQTHRFT